MGKEEAAKREAEARAKAEAEARAKANSGAGADGKTPSPGGQAPRAPGVPERVTLPDSDRATLYSGPTIVDDVKVADALKKLRSLEEQGASSPNVSVSVTDASSGDVTRVAAPAERAPRGQTPQSLTPLSRAGVTPAGKTGTLWGWMPSQESSDDSARTPAPPPRTPVASEVTPSPPTTDAGRQTAQRSGLLVGATPPPSATPTVVDPARVPAKGPRPTAIGHSTSTPAQGSSVGQPSPDERAVKGTMHGHSLHLPDDVPEIADEAKLRTAVTPAAGTPAAAPPSPAPRVQAEAAPLERGGLSQRTSAVVEAHPARPRRKVETRRQPPRAARRAAIFVAVVSGFVAGAFGYVRFHRPEPVAVPPAAFQQPEPDPSEEPAPNAAPAQPPVGAAPAPAEEPAPVAPAAPGARAAAEDQVAPPPRGAAPTPPSTIEDVARAARRDQPAHEPARAEGKKVDRHDSRRPSAAVEPTPRTAHPTPSGTKPAGKGKREDDPDGTLPLTE